MNINTITDSDTELIAKLSSTIQEIRMERPETIPMLKTVLKNHLSEMNRKEWDD